MPPDFDVADSRKKVSSYFAKYGFRVSMMYPSYFARINGVESERYFSPEVYFSYVVPALNCMQMRPVYTDKNFYSNLFYDVSQPHALIKKMGRWYYDENGKLISEEDAKQIVLSCADRLIVKPTIESCEGHGVILLQSPTRDCVDKVFLEYKEMGSFAIQRFVKQHPQIAAINPTSLNTMRLFTYRDVDGVVHCLTKQNFIRIGGKGSCKDNVSAGGGFAPLSADGMISERMYVGRTLQAKDIEGIYGVKPFRVPAYAAALDFARSLHERLPYFDSIGWDVAIGEDAKPIFIEFNPDANLRAAQIVGGPMFGEFQDEVMERSRYVQKSLSLCMTYEFQNGYKKSKSMGGLVSKVLTGLVKHLP